MDIFVVELKVKKGHSDRIGLAWRHHSPGPPQNNPWCWLLYVHVEKKKARYTYDI